MCCRAANLVLAERVPGLEIDADLPRPGDSMRVAMDQFNKALPGLRTVMELPVSELEICPWTLGLVNDDGNVPFDISVIVNWDDIQSSVFDFLTERNLHWKRKHWQKFIVDYVEEHMEGVRRALDEVDKGIAANVPTETEEDNRTSREPRPISEYSDPDNYERNKWFYQQRVAGTSIPDLIAELRRNHSQTGWYLIDSRSGVLSNYLKTELLLDSRFLYFLHLSNMEVRDGCSIEHVGHNLGSGRYAVGVDRTDFREILAA